MKRKVLIITTQATEGQPAVTKAISCYLESHYHIKTARIFADILGSVDPVKKISRGNYSGEQLYTYIAQKKWNRFINTIFYKLGTAYYTLRQKSSSRLLCAYIKKESPDIVISVTPFINRAIYTATQQQSLPLFILSPDFDPKIHLSGFAKKHHHNLYLGIPFANKAFTPKHITDHCLITGYPIGPLFFVKKDKKTIQKTLGIPPDKPTILIMTGSLGSPNLISLVQQLQHVSLSLHVIICAGKSRESYKKINQLSFPPHITKTICKFTSNIANFMRIADIFITKPGPGSIAEALYMNVPMLLDATSEPVAWEKANISFAQEHAFAKIITAPEQIPSLITHLLSNKHELTLLKTNGKKLQKKDPRKQILHSVNTIIANNTER